MAAIDRQAERIILGYSDRFLAIRQRLRLFAQVHWSALPDYRDPEILRFAKAMDAAVTGSQAQVAALTDQYLATVGTLLTGQTVAPVGIDPRLVNDLALRGVPAVDVYARTGPEVWYQLSQGAQVKDAIDAGLDRALTAASTDLQLAKTHTALEVTANDDRIIGYQRLPEGANPCELCLTAAENTYRSDDLMPIHDNCSCDIVPVYADGRTVDTAALRDSGQLDESQQRGDPVVREHGELGPILTVAGQDYFVPKSDRGLGSASGGEF